MDLISPGYYLILGAWLEAPEQWLSCRQVETRIKRSAYMHLGRMVRTGLLEERLMTYRPTRNGWLAHHDYQCWLMEEVDQI